MRYTPLRTPTPDELCAFLEERGDPMQLIPNESLCGMEVMVSPTLLKALQSWQNRKARERAEGE